MNANDEKAIRTGVRHVLDRRQRAYDDFVQTLRDCGAGEHAAKVAAFYSKTLKVVKFDGSRYMVKHGAFLDADTIAKAVAEVSK